ncbi:pirin family protein [Photobacterium sanguinicancri]|uniref:pirin family protein n=1 Tax=Photobacterium sanguinicancri TaxID=875932 RepID=UPI0026E3D6B4|nr:pirin family protein [Photobacterium sanguinicancri]MDO6498547.1 pirin family protein [Photobacterium sanguinicancri]
MAEKTRTIKKVRYGLKSGSMTAYIQSGEIEELNPFALWDHYQAKNVCQPVGLDFHGHSGVNTITYPICGHLRHVDSTGSQTSLEPGDVQMMLAGNGVIHKDTLKPTDGGRVETFALWVLLPANDVEMSDAKSLKFTAGDLPIIEKNNVTTKVLIGELNGIQSPITSPSPILVLDVAIAPYSQWEIQPNEQLTTGFIFIHSGKAYVSSTEVHANQMAMFTPSDNRIEVRTGHCGCRLLLAIGQPLDQSIIANNTSVHSSIHRQEDSMSHIEQLLKKLEQ